MAEKLIINLVIIPYNNTN